MEASVPYDHHALENRTLENSIPAGNIICEMEDLSDDTGLAAIKKTNEDALSEVVEPDNLSAKNDENDFVIFHCVSYLGASTVKECRSETEIQLVMGFMNAESVENAIFVSVSLPLHSNGDVIIYEEDSQEEISRYKVNQIIFFARGVLDTTSANCFAFTCGHGDTLENSLFQCHAFRCNNQFAVDRIFQCFARAFEVLPKTVGSEAETNPEILPSTTEHESCVFELSLEIKEDDGKGNFGGVPRDKGFFKLRRTTPKQLVLTIQQPPDPMKEFIIERCFGLLLSPGRHVRHSDMQLVEMLSWSIGSTTQDKKYYVITGQWDPNDPAFDVLNQETPKESGLFFTVAVDLVIKGIQEPIRFALEAKAKVYPTTERFWMIGRNNHFTQQFELKLKKARDATPGSSKVEVLQIVPLGEVDKYKANFNLNFTSFIRSSSLNSMDMETPTKEDSDDEPLQSGMGEDSKECSEEQLRSWGEILEDWNVNSAVRPKSLTAVVRAGIPDTLRGEIWQRLSGCHNDEDMMNKYKELLSKTCPNEDVILRDINRTFPGNDFFKESGGTGQELLLRLSKSFALYDTEVGYCQGISFVGAALLLKMPEEQAFCLLVKIMYTYEFRELFKNGFDNLHLRLYQLDRLMKANIPELWAHFQELGIESHMFASQWFLTLFTAKFPLKFVFRVVDVFLLEGLNMLFQVAVALLKVARKDLLVLDFEGVLKYFRVTLPKKFRNDENTNTIIRAATSIKMKKLKMYESDFLAIKEQEKNYVDPVTRLSQENKQLMEDRLRLDHHITNLVLSKTSLEENVELLQEELKKNTASLQEAEDFNQRLKQENDSVKELLQKEVKQYDQESEKKKSIIDEYKRICSKLSLQLEEEQKLSRERTNFFQTNLCEPCSAFVSTAMNLVSRSSNGDIRKTSPSPLENRGSPLGLASELPDSLLQPLENELAKTKISLAEAECKNDDLNHQLSVALAELETYRSNASGTTWLWKNLSFNKEHKRQANNTNQDEPPSTSSHPQ